jgi:hypothetical protein
MTFMQTVGQEVEHAKTGLSIDRDAPKVKDGFWRNPTFAKPLPRNATREHYKGTT